MLVAVGDYNLTWGVNPNFQNSDRRSVLISMSDNDFSAARSNFEYALMFPGLSSSDFLGDLDLRPRKGRRYSRWRVALFRGLLFWIDKQPCPFSSYGDAGGVRATSRFSSLFTAGMRGVDTSCLRDTGGRGVFQFRHWLSDYPRTVLIGDRRSVWNCMASGG